VKDCLEICQRLKGDGKCCSAKNYVFISQNQSGDSAYFFVELKGSAKEVDYAFRQIRAAITFVKDRMGGIPQKQIWGFIIGGKHTQNMNRLKEEFKRDIGIELKHVTGNQYEYQWQDNANY
jgi:hypothetical protein